MEKGAPHFCNYDLDEDDQLFKDDEEASEASLALIAGLRDGLFPNLQELSTRGGGSLAEEVPELVEVFRGGAPCARTLRTLEGHFPVDIDALQAVLPLAMVTEFDCS